ncbi:hypothetical protein C8D87_11329 [Lentzea atacamensis]|uniref:Uncharacterized protein n=1 Tax=Lentzea atacamensis TaxID=531938 RepID=A0ABX9DWD5_9PSEU|nr:hypothetical protein C8D87_11329 [Lentzea atacamensis]
MAFFRKGFCVSALTDDIPFGPFEGSPVRAYTTGGKNTRLHARRTCSSLRGSEAVELTVPLEAATVRRMCSACAEWGVWGRPATALGIFLDALMGTGLLYELDQYTPDDVDEDLEGRDVARAAELLSASGWPDDDELGEEYEDARKLRDDLLLPAWRSAAESLHAAHEVINRYSWLREWARSRMQVKAGYAEELRRLFASVLVPANLVDAAAVSLMSQPGSARSLDDLKVLGDVESVLRKLWCAWQREAATDWCGLEEHPLPVYRVLESVMGRKRKGRDEADRALTGLVDQWIGVARAARDDDGASDRWLIATVPGAGERNDRAERRRGFEGMLSRWEIGVVAVHATAIDWSSRVALLRVPELIARRLLDGGSLDCVEVDEPATTPVETLNAWIEQHIPEPDPGLLPGVLDDCRVAERKLVGPAAANALRATDAGEQPYLVYSVEDGVEVLTLDTVAARSASGWRGVIVASASDLPESLIEPWIDEIMSATDGDTDEDVGGPLGIQAGERRLVLLSRGDRRRIEHNLRILAVVRSASDLRTLDDGDDTRPVPHAVWQALLSPHQLDVTPFLPQDHEDRRRRAGLGLPLSVLASVQLYTTNLGTFYGKGHSPYCSHSRGRQFVAASHDLVTFADLLRLRGPDWCGVCGGYAVRRLNTAQLAYYRSAQDLLDISEQLDGWQRTRGYQPLDRDHVARLISKLDVLAERQPGERAPGFDSDSEGWRQAVREVKEKPDVC